MSYGPKPTPVFQRFWKHVTIPNNQEACWEWTGKTRGRFRLGNKDAPLVSPYRYSYELLNGKIPDEFILCHKCDNERCVRPGHLFVGTHSANTRDMYSKNRAVDNRGEKCGTAVLNEHQVRVIRTLRQRGDTLRSIADRYGVTPSAIHSINKRRTWRHVD